MSESEASQNVEDDEFGEAESNARFGSMTTISRVAHIQHTHSHSDTQPDFQRYSRCACLACVPVPVVVRGCGCGCGCEIWLQSE